MAANQESVGEDLMGVAHGEDIGARAAIQEEWDYVSGNPLDDARRALDDVAHATRHHQQDLVRAKRLMDKARQMFAYIRSNVFDLYDSMTGLKPLDPLINYGPGDQSTLIHLAELERLRQQARQWDYSTDDVLNDIFNALMGIVKDMQDLNELAQRIVNGQHAILQLFGRFADRSLEIGASLRRLKDFEGQDYDLQFLLDVDAPEESDSSLEADSN